MTTTATGNVRGTLWFSGMLILLVCFTAPGDGRPTIRMSMSETNSFNYLSRHGYLLPLNSSEGEIVSMEAMSEAISKLQSDTGIPVTGELDVATIQMMSIPRCDVNDKHRVARNAQWEDYRLNRSKWNHTKLTYKVLSYPRGLQPKIVDEVINKAFNLWAEQTFLSFIQTDKKADIEISFDKSRSDGKGGRLGWSHGPDSDGRVHFDANENWTINSYRGINLLEVATHEFGHALGIHHSNVESAVMSPYMTGYNPDFKLDIDDVQAIQRLYGVKSGGESEGSDVWKDNDVEGRLLFLM